jgi:hypothetical protein
MSTTDTEPIENVADIPSTITGIKASPCDDVISKLEGVIIWSGTSTEPTLDVIDKPVGNIVTSLSSPHSPSFQACAPQPTFKVVASFQLA